MTLLLIHAAATLFMTGLIWFVQVVHYPLMAKVGADGFTDYESHHQRLTTWVVGPAMLVEMMCASWLAVAPVQAVPVWLACLGLALLAVIWISTAMLQVPRHKDLELGFDINAHRRLVNSNWIRTVAWTLRSILALWMISLERLA